MLQMKYHFENDIAELIAKNEWTKISVLLMQLYGMIQLPEWVIWLVCDPGGTLIPSLVEQKYEQALLRWCGLSISL